MQQVRSNCVFQDQECLGCEPDAGTIDGWTKGLIDGVFTGSDVSRGFILSPEFIGKATSNQQFLDLLYNFFFDRAADTSGKTNWLGLKNSGTSRPVVLNGFIRAQEFMSLCGKYGIIPFGSSG